MKKDNKGAEQKNKTLKNMIVRMHMQTEKISSSLRRRLVGWLVELNGTFKTI